MSETTPAPEEWRAVVGYEGLYEVSDLGRVRGLDRIITVRTPLGGIGQRRLRGRILRPVADTSGRPRVVLSRGNRAVGWRVCTLVAGAFLEPQPAGTECCHGPGGKTDNRAVNLSWGTHEKNNGPDKRRDGTDANGERHGAAKLTWADVDEIRRRLPAGLRPGPRPAAVRGLPTQQELADEFGVSRRAVSLIIAGKTWRPEFRRHAS